MAHIGIDEPLLGQGETGFMSSLISEEDFGCLGSWNPDFSSSCSEPLDAACQFPAFAHIGSVPHLNRSRDEYTAAFLSALPKTRKFLEYLIVRNGDEIKAINGLYYC